MSIYNLPNNTTGLDGLVTQMTTGNFHWFVPIILFFVWIVVFLGGITRQKAKTGRADYSGWCIISSLSILLVALFFSISTGFMSLDRLIIVVTFNLFSAVWFFFDRKANEI